MSFERLEELAKEHYNTNKYAGHRFHMGRELSGMLMQRYQLPEAENEITRLRDGLFGQPLLYQLMGIPIVIDVALLEGPMQWILVDATGEEVERGELAPEHDDIIDPEQKGGRCEHGKYRDEPCEVCD